MKILVDMQGVQTESRHRGIGRYCMELTRAFVSLCRGTHDTTVLFNAALDGIDEAVAALTDRSGTVRRRAFGPLRDVSFDNRANDPRRGAAERVFTHALNVEEADVVWLGSVVEGFLDDAVVPSALPEAFTVATLYDLIPLHDGEYLGHTRPRDWYTHRLELLKRCDLLLAISEWVRFDAIERLGLDPNRIVAIGAGVDERFAPPELGTDHREFLRERFGITRPFVMYNGGFDKRKNVLALIDAYAALPKSLRAKHILVLVGRVDAEQCKRFAEIMATLHLKMDEVVFTGFVSDSDLVRLYQTCTLFVFPSEREGFGLAPLEAMACGAPAIANNATSLPEVVGNDEALFDAARPGAMTSRIEAVLTDAGVAGRLRRSGLERATQFSWQAVAARALAAIEKVVSGVGPKPRTSEAGSDASLPLYRANAENVAEVLGALRNWPGDVVWSGPLPSAGPSSAADRFRLGGYAGLLTPTNALDWLTLLESEAIGFVHDDGFAEDFPRGIGNARRTRPLARQREVEKAIATSVAPSLSDDDLARVADALVRVTPSPHIRWLVDVTHIATSDLGTGVHRVVRSILREWLARPPENVRVEPIAYHEGRFHHAHKYACDLLGIDSAEDLIDDLVAITGNEVYVGLDWAMESLAFSSPLLRTWRRAGVLMHFVIYDLLPITMPEAFHAQSRESFARWMATTASLADALHCISRATGADVAAWLREHKEGSIPDIMTFELGAEASTERHCSELDPGIEKAMSVRPSLLMVGTVEPRKGHEQVLDAMELLWESGADVNLIIVGHRGWLVKELTERLQQHTEKGLRLFWLSDANDETLEAVYERSTALLAASRGEGYGLPLIEAAQRGKPVIARSLPVFREVAGNYPSYFDTESPERLATYIARWLIDRPSPGNHPAWRSWAESAQSLQRAVKSFGRLHGPKL